jgi:hypothetical protein
VPACKFGNFLALFFMTGHAFDSRVSRELQREHRHVRFDMTLAAVFQFQVRSAGVAAGTGRNGFHPMGRMFGVAVKTGDFSPVFAAFALYCRMFVAVAFDAVGLQEEDQILRQARTRPDCCQQNNCTANHY